MMRKLWISVLAVVALCAIGCPQAYAAGKMYAWAEQGHSVSGNVGCTKTTYTGASAGSTTWLCADGAVGRFVLSGVPFPPGGANSWQYIVHFDATAGGDATCAWDVIASAIDDGAAPQSGVGNTASADGAFTGASPGERVVSGTSSATAVYNVANSANCTGSPSNCEGADILVRVVLDTTATTAESCEFRMLEIIY